MGHVGEEHRLRITCNLRRLQGFCKLPVLDLPFPFPLFSCYILLPLVKIIQNAAQEERDQHNADDNQYTLVNRPPLLLNCFNRYITNQENGSIIHCPHII